MPALLPGFVQIIVRWAGKSFSAFYFLFHLLASGKAVFLVKGTNNITYFQVGPGGTQVPGPLQHELDEVVAAVRSSWVLINVDSDLTWSVPDWINEAEVVVWTSAPNPARQRIFREQCEGQTWCGRRRSSKPSCAFRLSTPSALTSAKKTEARSTSPPSNKDASSTGSG
jgi:hypothetical protein